MPTDAEILGRDRVARVDEGPVHLVRVAAADDFGDAARGQPKHDEAAVDEDGPEDSGVV